MKISTLIISTLVILLALGVGFYFFLFKSVDNHEKKEVVTLNSIKERRIVAFGDSLTKGYNLPDTDSYPSQLQNKLNAEGYTSYKVINLGVNGETTTDGLARMDAALSYTPDIVLLEFGANDFLKSGSPDIARQNIESMLKKFDEAKVTVILVNVEPVPFLPLPNKDAFSKIMPELSKRYGLSLVPSFLDGVLLNDSLTLEDKLHPNKDGYIKALNQNLWPVLQRQLIK